MRVLFRPFPPKELCFFSLQDYGIFHVPFHNHLVHSFSFSHRMRVISSCRNGLFVRKPSNLQLFFWLHCSTKNSSFSSGLLFAQESHSCAQHNKCYQGKYCSIYQLTSYCFPSLLHCSLSDFSCFLMPIKI